jgi:hypothetical protein
MSTQLRGTQIISATIPSSALIATDISTVGTITAGTWNADPVAVLYGGTGATSASAARSNLGVAIGSNVEAWSATLDAVAAGSYVGSSSITTLGTIATGVWQGTSISASYLPSLDTITSPVNDVSMNSHKLTNLAAPQNANDAARLTDVQAAQAGLYWKAPVQVIANSNITLSSVPATIDSVTMSAGMRFAAGGQTNAAENGIYVYPASAGSAASRAADADGSAQGAVKQGMSFLVEAGTQANQGFTLTTANPITVGTTALTFVKFTGLADITPGNGLSKSGNTLNLVLDGSTLFVGSSGLKINAAGVTANELANASVGVNALNSAAFGVGLSGGSGSLVQVQRVMEEVSGSKNGTNTAFTVSHTPGLASLELFLNGLRIVVGTDFTLSGSNITMNYAPASTDSLQAVYFY